MALEETLNLEDHFTISTSIVLTNSSESYIIMVHVTAVTVAN